MRRNLNSRKVIVTGSISVVADAREVWALYTDSPLPETDYPVGHQLLPLSRCAAAQMQTVAHQENQIRRELSYRPLTRGGR